MPPLAVRTIGAGASRAAAAKPSARMPTAMPIVVRRATPSPLHHHQRCASSSSVVPRASEGDDVSTAAAPSSPSSPSSSSSSSSKFTVIDNDKLPLGKPTFDEKTAGAKGAIKFRLAFALPWRRFKSDSVLVLDVSGGIGEKRAGRFAPSALTMPQVRRRERRREEVFPPTFDRG